VLHPQGNRSAALTHCTAAPGCLMGDCVRRRMLANRAHGVEPRTCVCVALARGVACLVDQELHAINVQATPL
jgi:hypothetical protein